MYINCKTWFSFKYGTFRTEELVEAAAARGVTALALTNINSTWDEWDFVKHCRKAGIKPILGLEVRNGDRLLYLLLAANNRGLAWIHRFLSDHLMAKKDFPVLATEEPFFTDTWDGFVVYPWGAKDLADLLPNERVGVRPSELPKLFGTDLTRYADKLVLRQPVTVQNKKYHALHRLLRCIDKNILLSKLPPEAHADEEETFPSPGELLEKLKNYPFLVTNTYKLMDACHIEMDFAADKTKQTFGGTKEDDRILLEKLATDGLISRYGRKNKAAAERLKKELKIINDLGFNSYFLINHDIIRYAQSRGFYYVGRGSGANSIVAYCLKITDVDPIALNLYFERFLNPHRTSPPDFDIDFSWTDRDEIMDYVFKRYGKQQVALLGSYPTFKRDSTIRELGKVFGLNDEEIKTLQSDRHQPDQQQPNPQLSNPQRPNQQQPNQPHHQSNQQHQQPNHQPNPRYLNPHQPNQQRNQQQPNSHPSDQIGRLIVQYGRLLQGFPQNPSLHPCGMLISEKPLAEYVSLFMPPKGFPTAMMDMFVAEDISMNKFDILSQRGLGHIREALRLIRSNRQTTIDIHEVSRFMEDEKIAGQIREANTIGCFYIESPAMRQLLRKLQCADYLTLVAASSIIRPGVAQSGMMRTYIERYHQPEKVQYLHAMFEEHLSETFGVMVFQEDVIKIAHYFGGLDLGQADILRRAMSGKYRSNKEFGQIHEAFLASCARMGHSPELAQEVWRQMESFAGYSFNKAHSASFAVESYQSLYLKTYYPKEFMVAVINNFGGFYSQELYFMELRKTGANIEVPCVNNSEYYTTIRGNDVYMGLVHIKSLENKFAEQLLEERLMHGPYSDLSDFIERTHPSREQLNLLVSVGAFRFTGKTRKALLWEANFLQKKTRTPVAAAGSLFQEPPVEFSLPPFQDERLDDLYDQFELLQFPIANPFELVDDDPRNYVRARELGQHVGKVVTVLIYYIDRKVVPTSNRQTMMFGTFVDAELEWVDTVHFPDSCRQYPIRGRGFYKATGKVVADFGVYSIEVHRMYKVGMKSRTYANL